MPYVIACRVTHKWISLFTVGSNEPEIALDISLNKSCFGKLLFRLFLFVQVNGRSLAKRKPPLITRTIFLMDKAVINNLGGNGKW